MAPPFATAALPQDPAVKSAPQWNCSNGSEPHVVWWTKIGGIAGSVSANGEIVLVGAALWSKAAQHGAGQNRGAMLSFDLSGRPGWTVRHERMAQRIHDMGQPLHSIPCIQRRRAYYVSNRGDLVCLDLRDAVGSRIAWKLDLIGDLGVFRREAGDVGNPSSSPIIIGDLVFCVTGHGAREPGKGADSRAPSFVAVNKDTGKVAWSSNAPGTNIIYGQWSSPVSTRINGRDIVIFPGGDGRLYGFEARTGELLWKIDCNEHDAIDWTNSGRADMRKRRNFFVASPVVNGGMLYIGLNKDFEMDAVAPLLAVNLRGKKGPPTIQWKFNSTNFISTYTSAAVSRGLVFVTGRDSVAFALDASNGRELWHSCTLADSRTMFASPVVARGCLFVGDESGVAVYTATREKKCLGRYELGELGPSTPVIQNGCMYVAAGSYVYALRLPNPIMDAMRKTWSRIWPF